MGWKKLNEDKKLRFQVTNEVNACYFFFNWTGIIHQELVLEERTVSTEFYKSIMERLLKRVARVQPEMH